ncbi:hypothetical protein [Paenibacillus sp. Y412MC10]|nr:hypothetical protein [Paenibacillus sp. Y412MC10]
MKELMKEYDEEFARMGREFMMDHFMLWENGVYEVNGEKMWGGWEDVW